MFFFINCFNKLLETGLGSPGPDSGIYPPPIRGQTAVFTIVFTSFRLDVGLFAVALRFLAGGQGKLSGQIFRIGHLGAVDESDIQEVFTALEKVLPQVGFRA